MVNDTEGIVNHIQMLLAIMSPFHWGCLLDNLLREVRIIAKHAILGASAEQIVMTEHVHTFTAGFQAKLPTKI